MNNFEQLSNNISGFDLDHYLELWFDTNTEFITGLNKQRLLEEGTDVEGKEIRTFKAEQGEVYSGFTITEKQKSGQPTDKVTLFDTGEFHKSFKVDSDKKGFVIKGEDEKDDGKISDNVNLEMALGIFDLQPIIDKLKVDLKEEVLLILLG